MDWTDIIPHDLRAALHQGTKYKISSWRTRKLVSDLDTPAVRASYRRSSGFLVAGMIFAVAGLGFFSGSLAAGAGRTADDITPQSVCIAPMVSMAVPAQEESILVDYMNVFTTAD